MPERCGGRSRPPELRELRGCSPLFSFYLFDFFKNFLYNYYRKRKEDYYSHKTIVIDNIEYNIKDTEFIYYYEGRQLIIKLPNGDEIHTNNYKFKN